MRKKLPQNEKRSVIIGIKVKPETREKLGYVAEREDTKLSSLINEILTDYIDHYYKTYRLDWDEIQKERNKTVG